MKNKISRLNLIKYLGFGGMSILFNPILELLGTESTMLKKAIPSSNENLSVIGLGTWIQFDVSSSESERKPLKEVLNLMSEFGGQMIDSSPMYGRSEQVIGDLTTEIGNPERFFFATKVWTSGKQEGINQMNSSLKKMNKKTLDLMQIHNLVDYKVHLKTLKDWKDEGKIRYIGITHYTDSAHEQLEEIIKSEKIDFVQFNYSIQSRNAEKRLLNTAKNNGVAVIINEPFDKGSLFSFVKGKKLPVWVTEYDIESWGQYFLKYIISHPAVNCAIPGTSNPNHVVDNMKAGYGRLPDEKTRLKMVQYLAEI